MQLQLEHLIRIPRTNTKHDVCKTDDDMNYVLRRLHYIIYDIKSYLDFTFEEKTFDLTTISHVCVPGSTSEPREGLRELFFFSPYPDDGPVNRFTGPCCTA